MRKRRAYTLVELVVVMLLVSIIGGMSMNGLVKISQGYREAESRTEGIQRGHAALERMIRKVRVGRFDTGSTTANADSLTFPDQDGIVTAYVLSSGQLTENGNVLGDGASNLSFVYYDTNNAALTGSPLTSLQVAAIYRVVIRFTLTAGTVSQNFNGTVFLRCRDSKA